MYEWEVTESEPTPARFSAKPKSHTCCGSLTQPATTLYKPEACVTKRRSTNVLTSGSQKATKEQCLGLEIVHVYFREVDDSGVLLTEAAG